MARHALSQEAAGITGCSNSHYCSTHYTMKVSEPSNVSNSCPAEPSKWQMYQKGEKEKARVKKQNPGVSRKSPSKPVGRMGWLCLLVMTIGGLLCEARSLKTYTLTNKRNHMKFFTLSLNFLCMHTVFTVWRSSFSQIPTWKSINFNFREETVKPELPSGGRVWQIRRKMTWQRSIYLFRRSLSIIWGHSKLMSVQDKSHFTKAIWDRGVLSSVCYLSNPHCMETGRLLPHYLHIDESLTAVSELFQTHAPKHKCTFVYFICIVPFLEMTVQVTQTHVKNRLTVYELGNYSQWLNDDRLKGEVTGGQYPPFSLGYNWLAGSLINRNFALWVLTLCWQII